SCPEPSRRVMKTDQSLQRREVLCMVLQLTTEFERPTVELFHFRGCLALDNHQWRAQGQVQPQLLLEAPWRVRQGLEELQPLREVADRLDIRRALDRALARALPVGDGLGAPSSFRVVLRQPFWLHLTDFWEVLFQHLRNACVVLLADTA